MSGSERLLQRMGSGCRALSDSIRLPCSSNRTKPGSRTWAGAARPDDGFPVHVLSRRRQDHGCRPRAHPHGPPDSPAVRRCPPTRTWAPLAAPERQLLFDLNDFDETLPGPFEYDVKRLAASFTVAARNNGFRNADVRDATLAAVHGYRETMAEFAEMSTMDVWYAHLSETTLMSAIAAARRSSSAWASACASARAFSSGGASPRDRSTPASCRSTTSWPTFRRGRRRLRAGRGRRDAALAAPRSGPAAGESQAAHRATRRGFPSSPRRRCSKA